MHRSRLFLAGLILAYSSTGFTSVPTRVQDPDQELPRAQQSKPGQESSPDRPSLPNPEKKMLDDNEKNIKKKVERLYKLATELKEQVDKTDSSKVLSLDLLKKTEEIEKLARDIRNRSKG